MSLLDHLREFRRRTVRSAIIILAASILGWYFYNPIITTLARPVCDLAQAQAVNATHCGSLYISGVLGPLNLQIKVAFLTGLILSAPLWLFLFLMHGVLGEGPRIEVAWGGTVSASGAALALAQGSRLAAIITASLAFATAFDPHRFLQAAIARGWRFDAAYVVVATLDAADRLAAQARRLREAQRTRGLRVRGSLRVRIRALPALVFPLLLASLTEADERALALETRGLTMRGPRTAIDPPIDTLLDRAVRWGALAVVITALAYRLAP